MRFQAIDWRETDVKEQIDDDMQKKSKTELRLVIRAYGRTEKGKSVCVNIRGFQPYFYVKLPNDCNKRKDLQKIRDFLEKDKEDGGMGFLANGIVSIELVKMHELYWFSNNKLFKYAKLTFNSLSAFMKARSVFEGRHKDDDLIVRKDDDEQDKRRKKNRSYLRLNGFILKLGKSRTEWSSKANLYETKITPLLRFFHNYNIQPAGWIDVKKSSTPHGDEATTSCRYEYNCLCKNISAVNLTAMAPLRIASYDIECTSNSGEFPKPSNLNDPVIQIGMTLHKYGDKTCYKKLIVVLGEAREIPDCKVISVKSERELILTWASQVRKLDVDIITGYNLWGFDDEYIYERALRGMDYGSKTGRCAPYHEDLLKLLTKNTKEPARYVHQELKSSAMGDNEFNYFNGEGLISVDLLKYVRDSNKLDSYKLDFVSRNFIRNDIKKIEQTHTNGVCKVYTSDLSYLQDKTWISFDTMFSREDRKNTTIKMKKKYQIDEINTDEGYFTIKDFNIDECITDSDLQERFMTGKIKNSWFQNKVDLSPNKLFERFSNGTPEDITEIAIYCIQDCELVNFLTMKLEVIGNNTGMANVCLVPFSYLFTRGQGIKIFSLVAKYCAEQNYCVKTIRKDEVPSDGYEGAIVFSPTPGIYFEPVAVMDYASLYPSSMIAENISHETIVMVQDFDLENNLVNETGNPELLNLEEYNYNMIVYDNFQLVTNKEKGEIEKIKVGVKKCIYAELKTGEKGLMPKILDRLLYARRATRASIKYYAGTIKLTGEEIEGFYKFNKETNQHEFTKYQEDCITYDESEIINIYEKFDAFQKGILDGLQLAYKVVCNSLYGQLGASTSPICFKELAASTTAVGRDMVIKARDYTLEKYPGSKLVYGDSVVGDTPIKIRVSARYEQIKTFEQISAMWRKYHETKEAFVPDNMEVWTEKGWTKVNRVIRHKTTKKIYRVHTDAGFVDCTEDHSLIDNKANKIKPASTSTIGTTLMSSYAINKTKAGLLRLPDKLEFNSKLEAQEVFDNLYSKVNMKIVAEKNLYKIILIGTTGAIGTTGDSVSSKVKKIEDVTSQYAGEYVYDLETENHHFHAGVGSLIVHNTDSVFISFKDYIIEKHGSSLTDDELLKKSIEYGIEAGNYITSKLKHPQELEYEKTFYPFTIFTKKRYFGNKYETDINKYKQTYMGIALKRRDYCPLVKDIYQGVMDQILEHRNIEAGKRFFKNEIAKLLNGDVDHDLLLMSKTLRKYYSDPRKIVHKMLADRMGERDLGSKPQVNDRVQFMFIDPDNIKCEYPDCNRKVNPENCKCRTCLKLFCSHHIDKHKKNFICTPRCQFTREKRDDLKFCTTCQGYYCPDAYEEHWTRNDKFGRKYKDKCKNPVKRSLLQGDLVEDPAYIRENKIKVDYLKYYENQIKKPVQQIFELIMDKPDIITNEILQRYLNKINGQTDLSAFFMEL